MELVYLWVEDYKNIHEQGFNFSPKFNCHYDGETLTIKDNVDEDGNKQYIENFFGDNINVTAIVGKNGSGKSSVLESLSNNQKFIVLFENNEFQISKNIKVINNTKYKNIQKKEKLKSQYIVSADYILNNFNRLSYEKSFKNTNLENMNLVDALGDSAYLERTFRQLSFFINSKNNLNQLIFPKNIIIYIPFTGDVYSIYEKYKTINGRELNLSDAIYFVAYDFVNYLTENQSDFYTLLEKFFEYNLSNIDKEYSFKELFFELEKKIKDTEHYIAYQRVLKYCEKFIIYKDIATIVIDDMVIFKVPLEIFRGNLLNYDFFSQDNWFHINFKWDIKFSSGEMAIIDLLSSIYYELTTKNELEYIYIDEGESFLHPNWQKKYISYIVQFIKDNFPSRKIHIILTSHSPFLLSDIPKQNIIFLDKDEKGNCKVVDGLNEKKQTFGANIHTLLTDSFFMEGGLMGEFAKQKINEIIAFFKKENEIYKDDKEKLLKIINTIGEPFLKDKLLFMYNEKYPKTDDEKIKALEAEIKKIKNG